MAAIRVSKVFCGSPLISLALKNKSNFLAPLPSFPAVLRHSFHVSMSDNKQYHNTRRKRMLRRFKLNQLQAKLERLDEEDRPTGCLLCPMRGDVEIDYKNVRLLSQFVSPHTGRIYGRTLTGLCIKKQKEIAKAIRRARAMGFMPVTMKYLAFHEDPKLF
ncbi:28S ribosomal protein S18b, mitochondrial-like [Stylophora pistillata]|nr:28S ribosomal protein S18b, mitochondrial-like [Stylophora pistillata]